MFEGQYRNVLLPTAIKLQPFLFLTAYKAQRKAQRKLNENNPCNASRLHKRNVFATALLRLDTLLYIGGKAQKDVNIFHKHIFLLTLSLSTHCKTYCFTFQKRLFCTVKAQVLHRKRAAFAMPKRKYHFSIKLSLQNHSYSATTIFCNDRETVSLIRFY